MQAMKAGNQMLSEQMKKIDMDEMEDLYDDMADQARDMEEMQEIMGQNFNCEFDESELMGELDELDAECAMEQMGTAQVGQYIPNNNPAPVSTGVPAQAN